MSGEQPATLGNQRTYEWEDPLIMIRAIAAMNGADFAAALVSGTVPKMPSAVTLGLEIESAGDGKSVMTCAVQEWHCNSSGSVNGGLISAMIDIATGLAVASRSPAGMRQTTLDLNVRFVRAIPLRVGKIWIAAWVKHSGRRTAIADCVVRDSDGKEYAYGGCACMLYEDSGQK